MRGLLQLGVTLLLVAAASAQDARNVLVVINENSADSVAIGEYYQRKRGLPEANLCRLSTTDELVVDRKVYDREIRDVVGAHLTAHRLQDQILYIVTTLGVPLVVEGDGGAVGDRASVDSELALLYRHLVYGEQPRFGRADNPYFAVELRAGTQRLFRRKDQEIYLVTRLTGTSAVDAIFLVDRGMQAASDGRFYFDLQAQGRSLAASWLKEAAATLSSTGHQVQLEESRSPLAELQQVAGFATMHPADAVPEAIQWQPGGVALILGSPLEVARQSLNVVRQGATGAVAVVGDPGRDGYVRPQIFFNAWLAGHNLAESAGLATRYLSWRNVVIGDPLARPWASGEKAPSALVGPPDLFEQRRITHLAQTYGSSEEAIRALLRAEELAARRDWEEARAAAEASLAINPAVPETHELLAALLERSGEYGKAFEHYERILELTHDQPRVHLKLARIAIDELDDSDAAEPHARWLFAKNGLRDEEATRLWAEVQRGQGDLKQAEALYYRLIRSREEPPPFALLALAGLAEEQSQFSAAADFLRQALELEDLEGRDEVEQQLARLESAGATSGESAGTGASTPVVAVEEGDRTDGADSEFPTRPARVVHRVSPEYPLSAVEKRQEGRVVLRLLIDERGQLLKTKVILGHKRLVKAVTKTLPEWVFEPQLINGRPVVGWATVAIQFKIDETKPE